MIRIISIIVVTSYKSHKNSTYCLKLSSSITCTSIVSAVMDWCLGLVVEKEEMRCIQRQCSTSFTDHQPASLSA